MPNSQPSSVRLFASLISGSDNAADELFHRYVRRLSQLAQARLAPRLAQRLDPEDVVMSAYRSFFVAADAGRFAINESGDLWALLTKITLRKLYRSAAHHSAAKRAMNAEAHFADDFDLNSWVASNSPAPDEAAALSDEVEHLLAKLPTQHRRIIELRLQGEYMRDIAQELNLSERTVRRALTGIATGLKEGHHEPIAAAKPEDRFATKSAIATDQNTPTTTVEPPETTIHFEGLLLQKLIGRGGMGKIYKALQQDTGQLVAVKFLHRSFQTNAQMVNRFLNEANIVTQLQHPNIVNMHGIGRTDSGVYFLTMDLIDGQNLGQITHPVSLTAALRWTGEIENGLQHAHAAGVVHCDLKPANIIIGNDGQAVSVDFGLAQIPATQHHRSHAFAGTAPWIAPEQVDSSFGTPSHLTDVYGLGALLYTVLTGQPPFSGNRTSDVLSRVISAETPRAPSKFRPALPASMDELCLRCLAKRPDDRPASISEVATLLAQIEDLPILSNTDESGE